MTYRDIMASLADGSLFSAVKLLEQKGDDGKVDARCLPSAASRLYYAAYQSALMELEGTTPADFEFGRKVTDGRSPAAWTHRDVKEWVALKKTPHTGMMKTLYNLRTLSDYNYQDPRSKLSLKLGIIQRVIPKVRSFLQENKA